VDEHLGVVRLHIQGEAEERQVPLLDVPKRIRLIYATSQPSSSGGAAAAMAHLLAPPTPSAVQAQHQHAPPHHAAAHAHPHHYAAVAQQHAAHYGYNAAGSNGQASSS